MTARFDCTVDELKSEDFGKALILTATPFAGKNMETGEAIPHGDENGIFFCIHSWDDNKQHEEFNSLGYKPGDQITITVEVWKGQ